MEISTLQQGEFMDVSVIGRLDESWASHLDSALSGVIRAGAHHIQVEATTLGNRLIMMHRGIIAHDLRGPEKRRVRVRDLMSRFDDIRRAEQLDETAAEVIRHAYV